MATIKTIHEFRNKCRKGVPILMFHKIDECPKSANLPLAYVSPAYFDKLFTLLARDNFHSVSISDTLHGSTANRFVISFDDGYESVLLHGAEQIKARGFNAIEFLVADRLGQRNEWDLGVDNTMERLMDRTQVQEWLSLGFEIGAHTLSHPRLSRIPLTQAKNEIVSSKKKLEDLFGTPVKHFAYPWGDYNDAIVDLVREAGFETACTCDGRVARADDDPHRLGRFFVGERSFRCFSHYKFSYLSQDLKSVGKVFKNAFRPA
jgi:peptidoglycan/xylan/chitin deacetylase (PgdA/CDA1 family)